MAGAQARTQTGLARSERVSLTVYRSAKHTYAQLVDPSVARRWGRLPRAIGRSPARAARATSRRPRRSARRSAGSPRKSRSIRSSSIETDSLPRSRRDRRRRGSRSGGFSSDMASVIQSSLLNANDYELNDRVIHINRVSKVVKGGRLQLLRPRGGRGLQASSVSASARRAKCRKRSARAWNVRASL